MQVSPAPDASPLISCVPATSEILEDEVDSDVGELTNEEYKALCDIVTDEELLKFQADLHAKEISQFSYKVSPTYTVIDGEWFHWVDGQWVLNSD